MEKNIYNKINPKLTYGRGYDYSLQYHIVYYYKDGHDT